MILGRSALTPYICSDMFIVSFHRLPEDAEPLDGLFCTSLVLVPVTEHTGALDTCFGFSGCNSRHICQGFRQNIWPTSVKGLEGLCRDGIAGLFPSVLGAGAWAQVRLLQSGVLRVSSLNHVAENDG
jgi:hypothetical protein